MLALLILLPAGGCAWFEPPQPVTNERARVTSPPLRAHHPPAPPKRPAAPTASVRLITLGRSVNGTGIFMHVFGDAAAPTFIFAGIHGDEPTPASVAHELCELLKSNPRLWDNRSVAVICQANPDGLSLRTRGNSRGVDLNRNFPASNWCLSDRGRYHGGPRPQSEPETCAIVRAVDMLKPGRIVSIHSISRGKHCNNYDGPAEHFAREMAAHNRYPAKASIGYPTPGSFGTWAGKERAIPTITLELPADLSAEQCWTENRQALLAIIRAQAVAVGK